MTEVDETRRTVLKKPTEDTPSSGNPSDTKGAERGKSEGFISDRGGIP